MNNPLWLLNERTSLAKMRDLKRESPLPPPCR